MKKIFSYLAIAALLVAGVSCNKNLEPASITLSVTELTVNAAGEETTVGVKCNRDWKASVDVDWITLTPSSAEAFEASSYMILKAEANEGFDRTAIITVSTRSGELSAMLEVYQGEDDLVIKDVTQFVDYLEKVANDEIPSDIIYKLGEDVDLEGVELPVIAEFNNTFDGNEYSLLNWTTDKPLFQTIGTGGSVSDLVFDESCVFEIPGTAHFGFLTGINKGSIEGVINNADITIKAMPTVAADTRMGSICGFNQSVISGCENYGNITYTGVKNTKNSMLGGIVGGNGYSQAAASITDCYNAGNIEITINEEISASNYVAGVTCWNGNKGSVVKNCINEGNITIKAPGSTGMVIASGVAAYVEGSIDDCTNSGAISYFAESTDGAADGQIRRTGVTGVAAVVGVSSNKDVAASNCHNDGDITLRAGYSSGHGACGNANKYATNVAGVFGHMVKCGVDDCSNSGTVTMILADIDNAASQITTAVRQSCAGVVASSWGEISDCTNSGEINVRFTVSLEETRAAFGKEVGLQVGGVSAGDYHSDQKSSSITDCENEGNINYICDATGYNNSLGGIVGWPHIEKTAAQLLSGCENTGTITCEGYGKTRVGGVSGGVIKMDDNKNEGKIHFKQGHASSVLGGVSAVLAGVHPMTNCENVGEIVSDVALTGGIGGLVGSTYNQANCTINSSVVNCDITVPSGTGRTFMLVGYVDSNKYQSGTTPATTKNVYGTEDEPNVVEGGSITKGTTTTEITESNYATNSLPWDVSKTPAQSGLINTTGISYNVIFD